MNILLAGGAGYIGSHTAIVLIEAGHSVFIVDNFCNSDPSVISQIEEIANCGVKFLNADIRDIFQLTNFFKKNNIEAVIHFAGLKAVGESCERPLGYYSNNVEGTISLLKAMENCGIKKLVFSSSATVYGQPQYLPIDESHPTKPVNPYGRTKLIIEDFLRDMCRPDPSLSILCLRYFNPVGAHDSGLIGESPAGYPNNLMPLIAMVASGRKEMLEIYGDDYQTIDGTGVRDYIHVMDLAEGHKAAIDFVRDKCGFDVINLGTGSGISVLELIRVFEGVINRKLNHQRKKRRSGDVAACYADVKKASLILSWRASRSVIEMCDSVWKREVRKIGK